jgi:hypothetical protein
MSLENSSVAGPKRICLDRESCSYEKRSCSSKHIDVLGESILNIGRVNRVDKSLTCEILFLCVYQVWRTIRRNGPSDALPVSPLDVSARDQG